MKITYSNFDDHACIWLNGPFWQLSKARRIADAGLIVPSIDSLESKGITFQITLYGKTDDVLLALKNILGAI